MSRLQKQRLNVIAINTHKILKRIRAEYRYGHKAYTIEKHKFTHDLVRVLNYWGVKYKVKLKIRKTGVNGSGHIFDATDPSTYKEQTALVLIFKP
ncbi:hypothetical protein [Vibrio phage vB_VhaP_PG11]|nr:hypothetical protein [Vibrio phage vB_VhaP_PG11]